MQDKLEKALEKLQEQNIITPIQFSEWAARGETERGLWRL